MGRRPNPLILEYFDRGPKLNDNSNRYPHTCKQCGENFPKGRIDSLTTHITKKCPAISDANRMRACLELHGINAAKAADRHGLLANVQHSVQGTEQQPLPQGWSALETLAEASRQVDLNENSRVQNGNEEPQSIVDPNSAGDEFTTDRFELQEQFTLENPPGTYDGKPVGVKRDPTPPPSDWTPEERLQALLPRETSSPDVSNISVAVAATARLNPSFLDPSLAEPEATAASPATEPTQTTEPPALPPTISAPEDTNTPPWGEISYVASPAPGPLLNESLVAQMTHSRGGVRMDTSDGHGRPRNSRARFSPARRKEVQEIRKIGACIRCRILRKNCGKGDPCDTCKKVLSPRVWRVGCVRTRLHEQLDLYSAGVQVVLSQNRLNVLKQQLKPVNNGTTLQVSHFPETDILIDVPTMCAMVDPSEALSAMPDDVQPAPRVIMIDQDAALIPEMVEQYMRSALPLFIERETSDFMKTTLVTAQEQYEETEEDVLKKALELWGLVEIIDRERQWTFLEKPAEKGRMPRWIKEASDAPNGSDADIYTMLCMQLNAAAERKANQTSKSLLGLMHRLLQDSKTRINFRMYIASLIFLNCVEKSTWAFKAWEQAHLRPGWPLERDPSVFMQQGSDLANLLRMLLGIRKALPDTERSEDGKLKSRDHDPEVVRFFERLDLDYDTIAQRQKKDDSDESPFSPVDSRSLELTLCSHLLLPSK